MKRIDKLALEGWKATGWGDFATGYPVWHEAYLEGYHQALSDAANKANIACHVAYELMVQQGGNLGSFAKYVEGQIRALADEEDSDDASRT